jgi:hypothetical protein
VLKRWSSSYTLCFSPSSFARRRPPSSSFARPKCWKSDSAKSELWGGQGRRNASCSLLRTKSWQEFWGQRRHLVSGILGERCHSRFRAICADINPLNADLNPICHLLVLLGAHPILYISRIRVNPLNAELNPICHLLALLGAHRILLVGRIRVKEVKTTNLKGSAKREDESSRHPPYSPDLAPSDFHLFDHCFGRFSASPCVLVRAACK